MDAMRSEDGTVTLLYKCKEGKGSGSWGMHCATAAGVPDRIVERGIFEKTS